MGLQKQDIENLLILLKRVTLRGDEVETFVELHKKLKELLSRCSDEKDSGPREEQAR